jgi:hypothetical protein
MARSGRRASLSGCIGSDREQLDRQSPGHGFAADAGSGVLKANSAFTGSIGRAGVSRANFKGYGFEG